VRGADAELPRDVVPGEIGPAKDERGLAGHDEIFVFTDVEAGLEIDMPRVQWLVRRRDLLGDGWTSRRP